MLRIELEPNERYGEGYQAKVISVGEGIEDTKVRLGFDSLFRAKVLDNEPYSLYEIVRVLDALVDRYDDITGTDHDLRDVLWITEDAVRANRQRDTASGRLFRELREGSSRFVDLPPLSLEEFLKSGEDGRTRDNE